ncbi:MAG: STT3 domain-containing protein [Myxococcota bacterium]|nr:STT3 domain-containing protein [Myxococcota bacterium]
MRVLALLALIALILAVRALGFEFVWMDGETIFPPADAQYHVRRALYTFENFPAALLFDPYVNFPGGAPIPWPPLFDFVVGGVAFFWADDVSGFERVAALSAPVCAALAAIPIYLAGRRLGSPTVGLAAVFFFAWLPLAVSYTRLGNADHHAAVSMIGAWLLYAGMALSETDAPFRRLAAFAGLLFLARTALLLTWHGSLLYIGLADGLILLAGVLSGRRALLGLQMASLLGSLVIVIALVGVSPEPLGGPYSSIALSWLDALALLAVAWVALIVLGAEALWPGLGAKERLAAAASAGLVYGLGVLLLPGPREGLALALGFLTLSDGVGQVTAEQTPLFSMGGRDALRSATLSWGYFAYLLPFAPAAAAWAALRRGASSSTRSAALYLLVWSLVLSLLTLWQRRYGNDFAPAAALLSGFACVALLESATRNFSWGRGGLRTMGIAIGAFLLILALFWPALETVYFPRAQGSWAALSADPRPRRDVATSVSRTLHDFLHDVRRLTPETSGYLGGEEGPEYGVISPANLGHAIQYEARRPTATDPFWWYIGPENWDRSLAFLADRDETSALQGAEALQARYVVTSEEAIPSSVVGRLHIRDGSGWGSQPGLGHFRLLAESKPGGLGLGSIFRNRQPDAVAYKLFEIVPGARLEVQTEPGTRVAARIDLRTNQGREFSYRSSTKADPMGWARLTLPYATEWPEGQRARSGPLSLYRIQVGDRSRALRVNEADVVEGRVIRLEPSIAPRL